MVVVGGVAAPRPFSSWSSLLASAKADFCEVEEATRLCVLHHSGFEFRAVSGDCVPIFFEDVGDVVEVGLEIWIQLRKGQQESRMVVALGEDDGLHFVEDDSGGLLGRKVVWSWERDCSPWALEA